MLYSGPCSSFDLIILVFYRTRERTQDVNFWMKSFLRNIGTALEENLADTEVSRIPCLLQFVFIVSNLILSLLINIFLMLSNFAILHLSDASSYYG